MNTQTQPGTSVETTAKATSPSRWPRDLGDLLPGWPFAGPAWPFSTIEVPTGASIRLEEFVDNDQMVVKAELPGIDPEKDVEIDRRRQHVDDRGPAALRQE